MRCVTEFVLFVVLVPTTIQRHHSRLGDQKLRLSVVVINLLSSGCND